jgi:hypothetical protein
MLLLPEREHDTTLLRNKASERDRRNEKDNASEEKLVEQERPTLSLYGGIK